MRKCGMGKNKSFEIKISLEQCEDGDGYFIHSDDFPGCMSEGKTQYEALQNFIDILRIWLKAGLEDKCFNENTVLSWKDSDFVEETFKDTYPECFKEKKGDKDDL